MALTKSSIEDEQLSNNTLRCRRPYSYIKSLDIDSESDLDFDSDLERGRKSLRLRGGAAGDDDTDAINLDEPAVEKPKKREEPLTTREKILLGFHYLKMIILFIIWLISAIILMTNEEHIEDNKIIVVPPNGTKQYVLPDQNIGDRLQVKIGGPLVVQDDLYENTDREAPILIVGIKRAQYAPDRTISGSKDLSTGTWCVELMPEDQLKNSPEMTKSHTFRVSASDVDKKEDVVIVNLQTNVKVHLTLKITINNTPMDKTKGITYGSFVLIGLYVLIIWEIVDRTFAAVIACTAAIAILTALEGRPSMETIISWLDVETLLLLFGMMVLVATLAESGIFDYLAVFAYKITKGKVWSLINCLCAFVFVLSAILDNVTMMLLVTPVTIRLCEVLSLKPVPILMCMVFFSNVGAALTPVGDPPNVIITAHPLVIASGINFGVFVIHMLPGIAFSTVTSYIHLRFKYRKPSSLAHGEEKDIEEIKHEILTWERARLAAVINPEEEQLNDALERKIERLKEKLNTMTAQKKPQLSFEELLSTLEAEYPIRNKMLLIKSMVAFGFVCAIFALHSFPHLHHLSLGWTALLGAIMLFILADIQDIEAIMSRVEWSTLLFFAALIILMEAQTELGLIETIGDMVVGLIRPVAQEHRLLVAIIIIIWVSAITSAFLSNIPVTTMMIRIVVSLAENKDLMLPLQPLIWALAFGACFGGNGTLIGASANVVCGGVAAQHGYSFGFVAFFLAGFPVVLNTVAVATIYLLIAHVVFEWH